jgi:hypothetical protein
MAHNIYLFAGHPQVLRRYEEASPLVRLYRLTPGADLAVMPVDDALHDDLHRRSGTGEWLETLRLTTADLTFAAETSCLGALAYLETDYAGGTGIQAAALWGGGALAIRPLSMMSGQSPGQSPGRPRATWPINAVLRGLGIVAATGRDEFDTFGLGGYRSNAIIAERALPSRILP